MKPYRTQIGEFTLGEEKFKGIAVNSKIILTETGDICNLSEEDIENLECRSCANYEKSTTLSFAARAYELYLQYRAETTGDCEDSEAFAEVAHILSCLKGNEPENELGVSEKQKADLLKAIQKYECTTMKGKSFDKGLWFIENKSAVKGGFGFACMTYWGWLERATPSEYPSFYKQGKNKKWSLDKQDPEYKKFLHKCYNSSTVKPLYEDLITTLPNAVIGKNASQFQLCITDAATLFTDFGLNVIITSRTVDKITEIFLNNCEKQ